MKKLKNGWHMPDDEIKMTSHIEADVSMSNPSYEERHRLAILKNIPQKNTFVDVGANVGVWSMALSTQFNKVISFEPSVRNRECLEANLGKVVEIRPYAVGNASGKVNFRDAVKNCGDSKISLEKRDHMYEVEIVKLDDQNITNCSLIKIDVQGFELPVVEGALRIIKEQQPWIIFEINEDVDVICNILEKQNYEMIRNKSKRVMIWAPTSGKMKPLNSDAFGRHLGPGPYVRWVQ